MKKIKKISIVIPVWNEQENVKLLVESFDKVLRPKEITYELIFVDDHSTDRTRRVIKSLAKKYPLSLHLKEGRRGKAYSLLEGIEKSQYNLVGFIDGDLQYPPSSIPQMIKKIEQGADIVVANRNTYQDSFPRKILSNGFKWVFGKLLFGLDHDVQSGLKVFKREVMQFIKFQPASGWTFDLEFLHRASEAGFKITSHDISFHPRHKGRSKVQFVKVAWELGTNALRLRTKRIYPQPIPPTKIGTMLGAGVRYKKQKYITHTTLPHHKSAIQTTYPKQKLFLALILLAFVIGFWTQPLLAALIGVAILSFIYFIDVLFNLFLILKSLHYPQEIAFEEKELQEIDDKTLPVYSILCPLYKEAKIVPQFLEAINNIDWPKEKLDLILLLEEDDHETIEALNNLILPFYVRKVIVPHSIPKTKPKACNYGLSYTRGEYLVVYDAEDIPDPLQLKKAYLGFGKVPKDVICLQAKLNYYNPHQNLLTKLFTTEYSLWFDVTLTGLQSVNTSIPLGGTSNHFRKSDLLKLQGWDPFNVTEDADLGVRLFKEGYKTAMIDSTTLEEANSQFRNWLRQRSRWIKGYMQTYLVHIRETASFAKSKGVHSLIFQLVIGGKIAFILINPFLWIATISYFTLYSLVGPTIESLYPPIVFYTAVFSLVFGNFMFLYYHMIGAFKRQEWVLIKYVYLVPFYWVAISLAGFIALYQLLSKPHYWEKTIHGLHLKKSLDKVIPGVVIEGETGGGFWFPVPIGAKLFAMIKNQKKYLAGTLFVASLALGNFLNFVFNAYLGRVINLADFAEVNLTNSFLSLTSILFGAFGVTVGYRSGYLIGKFKGDNEAYQFWRYIRRHTFPIAALITIIWFVLTPFLASYFRTSNIFLFILFGWILLIRFAAGADKGFLSAKLMFISLAVVSVSEPIIKLATAFIFVQLALPDMTYAAIPIAVLVSFIIGWALIDAKQKTIANPKPTIEFTHFPKKFFFVSLLSGLSTMTFLSLDIILAKHFLPPEEAGKYALISLVGKMIYFMGSLFSQFVVPLVSRNEGANKSSQKTFSFILLSSALLSLVGFIIFGPLGQVTVPFLYGPKALSILPYLTIFAFAMMCFTISRIFPIYYLTKKIYSFSIGTCFLAAFQFVLISFYHSSLESIVLAMTLVGAFNLILMVALHLKLDWVKIVESNFVDFLGLFFKLKEAAQFDKNRLKILIFNWRDIRHKWNGGAEVYIHEMATRWARKGHKVTLFCGNDGHCPRNETIDGVGIIRRGGFYFVYIWAFLYYLFLFKGKYDVILDCENGIPFFTPLYAREKKFLIIHHVHQEVFRKSLAKPFSILASFLEMKVMPFVYKNIQVITVSPSSKKEILDYKLTDKEPLIIYNGVDLAKYTPAQKSPIPLILYLGRLQYYKSLHVFIQAAQKVLEIIPDAQFVIAGEGERKQGLMKFAEKLNLKDRINFLGRVSEEEKIRLYQQAWAFVNPSFMEGWGITTIEANACGTAVVASDVPGLRDSVQNPHTGILAPWGDTEEFAYNIEKIIIDQELRLQMEKDALEWAKQFSWEKSAQSFLNLLSLDLERPNPLKKAAPNKDISYYE